MIDNKKYSYYVVSVSLAPTYLRSFLSRINKRNEVVYLFRRRNIFDFDFVINNPVDDYLFIESFVFVFIFIFFVTFVRNFLVVLGFRVLVFRLSIIL